MVDAMQHGGRDKGPFLILLVQPRPNHIFCRLPTNNNNHDINSPAVTNYNLPTIYIMLMSLSYETHLHYRVASSLVRNGCVRGRYLRCFFLGRNSWLLTGNLQWACEEFLDAPCLLHTRQCPSPWGTELFQWCQPMSQNKNKEYVNNTHF
jgi:hypothetical protein